MAQGEGSAADTGDCHSSKCVNIPSQHVCKRAEEKKKLQNNQFPGCSLNLGPPEHEENCCLLLYDVH